MDGEIRFLEMIRFRSLAFLFAFARTVLLHADHDQHLDLIRPVNFVSIVLHTGGNRVSDLLPNAPVGTLVFKFDNARGYIPSQAYSNGWSNPDLTIKPSETVIMMPPRGQTYHAHLIGHRDYPPPVINQGWNLLPSRAVFPLDPLREIISPRPGDQALIPVGQELFALAYYDSEQEKWIGSRVPEDGMWYRTSLWPPNPGGEFQLRESIYFNNFAPAFGIDEPFLDQNGCPLDGMATLLRKTTDGQFVPLGEAVPVQAGYLDSRADLMRYLDSEGQPEPMTLAVSFAAFGTISQSAPFTVRRMNGLQPVGLTGFEAVRRPKFLLMPESQAVAAGTNLRWEAVFNYATNGVSLATQSLERIVTCGSAPDGCPIHYQWQRLDPGGTWTDIPDATASALLLAAVRETDYGRFRLKATWGCRTDYSAAATIRLPVAIALTSLPAGFDVNISAEGAAEAVLQISTDLANWQTYRTVTGITNTANVSVPRSASKIFFRVLATFEP